MKIKHLFVLLFLSVSINIYAQDADSTASADSLMNDPYWDPSIVTSFNLSQIAFTNWSKGGENSFSWVVGGDFGLKNLDSVWRFSNMLSVEFGKTQVGDQIVKTTDNEITLESVLSYHLGWAVNPYVSNFVRTQLTEGYDYEKDPAEQIADFWDPGYVTQATGFTYDKLENFRTRLGIAFKETFTNEFTQYSDDPETVEIEDFKFETGVESVTGANYNLDDNIVFTTSLRLFSRFEMIDVWDVRWDNKLTASVNDIIKVNFTYLVVYEKAQTPKTQTKQALQVGVVYTIL